MYFIATFALALLSSVAHASEPDDVKAKLELMANFKKELNLSSQQDNQSYDRLMAHYKECVPEAIASVEYKTKQSIAKFIDSRGEINPIAEAISEYCRDTLKYTGDDRAKLLWPIFQSKFVEPSVWLILKRTQIQ